MPEKHTDILDSWKANARLWVEALDNRELETRVLVTNEAVVNAVVEHAPAMVLDAGCGEGWLCRTLQQRGIETVGVDGVPELIHEARMKGPGHFEVLSFEELLKSNAWPDALFDVVVFNFCLYGQELTEELLRHSLKWVRPGGKLVLQTLHPFSIILNPGESYHDGWRMERWAGLNKPFTHPYHWYYRTFSSWLATVTLAGWHIKSVREPLHPVTRKPASLILAGCADKKLR
jgi:2-polyprenyl-3-methyl-5-hydroxy-6-metoxy-1,4-benzoquinol methylase